MPSDPSLVLHTAPLLPLRDIIIFPNTVVPLFVGRAKSIQALKEAMAAKKEIVLCAQRKAKTNEPERDDIFEVGTLGAIRQLIQLPDGTVKVLVMGERRVKVVRYLKEEAYFQVEYKNFGAQESLVTEAGLEEAVARLHEAFEAYVKLNRRIPPELLGQIAKIESPSKLIDMIAAQLSLKISSKQQILEIEEVKPRLERLLEMLREEIEILQVEQKIRSRVKKQMAKTQKDLSEETASGADAGSGEFRNEIEELEGALEVKELPAEARERANREVRKLKMMNPMSAEATVVRNYIDWILNLPWGEQTEDNMDLAHAKGILDADHFGLDKPKDRILEYLAVRSLSESPRGPILCFSGPPGVGKTSLGRSIATALGRKFVRLSLGGVRDEAEIRGHRRTYIGAMPGKVIQSIQKAESANPVFLLDEIDKMSTDFRGDPSSALLEVLDPEQNSTFGDHYLDLDYDLSHVMFICTANDLRGIPGPLRDRLEIIELPGYTPQEKLQIAKNYLVPKQIKHNGLHQVSVGMTDASLLRVIEEYTREAGVRQLEREVGSLCRKLARRVVEHPERTHTFKVRAKDVSKLLGPSPYAGAQREQESAVGLTHGMAWTQFGGVMLVCEAAMMPGSGKLIITGKLGEVMQESAQAAMTYVRSRSGLLGLSPDFHKKVDLHVHFPEGAMPKDGPSAGITIVTSIVSCLTQTPVRHDVAMTGEITLRGRVLPIGGLKEKLLAAHRQGVKTALVPKDNRKDLREIPQVVQQAMQIMFVEHVDEVLAHALEVEDPQAFLDQLRTPVVFPEIAATGAPEPSEPDAGLPGPEAPVTPPSAVHKGRFE